MTENPQLHNQMISRLHEKAAMGEGCMNDNEDHANIMSMLQRRVATGEGEYGGWAKDQVIGKAQYLKMMKARGYTKKVAEDKYKVLQKKRRAAGKKVTRGTVSTRARAPARKKLPAQLNDWNSFRGQYKGRKCTIGQVSDLYAQSKGKPRPVRSGPYQCSLSGPITTYEGVELIQPLIPPQEPEVAKLIVDIANEAKRITTQHVRPNGLPLTKAQIEAIAMAEAQAIRQPIAPETLQKVINGILIKGSGEEMEDYYGM